MRKYKLRISGVLVAMGYAIIIIISIGCNRNSNKTIKSTPNLVLILVDDLGYGDLPSYGNLIVKTPNIDKLVRWY